MGELRNFVTPLHQATKRDYLARMMDDKVHCMKIAKQYGKDYWDGDRRYGYGGYNYMPGRWKSVAQELIKTYDLGPGSKVLDVGCGKGFLLHEMLMIEPKLAVKGFDLSGHGVANSTDLRLLDLPSALNEIQRVGKQSYVMVESYRNEQELFNLQCWALTCESFFDNDEWLWLYKKFGYGGDYEFIFFE